MFCRVYLGFIEVVAFVQVCIVHFIYEIHYYKLFPLLNLNYAYNTESVERVLRCSHFSIMRRLSGEQLYCKIGYPGVFTCCRLTGLQKISRPAQERIRHTSRKEQPRCLCLRSLLGLTRLLHSSVWLLVHLFVLKYGSSVHSCWTPSVQLIHSSFRTWTE
jgi:hypothetical protein